MSAEKKREINIVKITPGQEIDRITECGQCKLFWTEEDDGVHLCFVSRNHSVRALEFLDYLVSDYAMAKGGSDKAEAIVSYTFLKLMLSDMEVQDIGQMLEKKTELYYSECDWIYAQDYVQENQEKIQNLPVYVKKKISWAYVKSTDIVDAGEKFCMRSLEHESDLIKEASEDTYIMIGCRGEIYDIKRDKFEKTYEAVDKQLDIYEKMLDFLPEVRRYPEGTYISLDELAHLCQPRNDVGIYGMRLDRRTKVFTPHNHGEYFLGRAGDYLAIREDDIMDMYVIQREIFMQTYERR